MLDTYIPQPHLAYNYYLFIISVVQKKYYLNYIYIIYIYKYIITLMLYYMFKSIKSE